jgi:hypothetical protein
LKKKETAPRVRSEVFEMRNGAGNMMSVLKKPMRFFRRRRAAREWKQALRELIEQHWLCREV